MSIDFNKTEQLLNDISTFSEGCYLLEHIKQLTALNQNIIEKKPYKNFAMLDEIPSIVIQEMMGKKGVESLFQITSAQIALLVPKIQLFKIVYQGNDKKGIEKELKFNDFTNPRSIDNITKDARGRGDDVGIKSFEYELTGKNPAEGGLVRCKLILYFQNIKSLVESGNETDYRSLIVTPVIKVNKKEQDKQKDAPEKYKNETLRVKAIVGWATPLDPIKTIVSDELLKAINNSRTILYMTLIKHDIDFRENGSVELNLEYQGAMEGVLNAESSNIFWLTKHGHLAKDLKQKEEEEQRRKLEEKQKTQSSGPDSKLDIKNITNILTKKEGEEIKLDIGSFKNREELQSKLRNIVSSTSVTYLESLDKQEKYSRLIYALYNDSRIFYTDVTPEQIVILDEVKKKLILARKDKENITNEQLKKELRAKREKDKSGWQSLDLKPIIVHQIVDKQSQSQALDPSKEAAKIVSKIDVEAKIDPWSWSGMPKTVTIKTISREEQEKAASNLQYSVKTKVNPDGTRRINFIFLGDLLDIVLAVLMDEKRTDNYKMRVVLGSCIIPIFNQISEMAIPINLANIPISLNMFNNWYIDKVIKAQKEVYMLGDFIKDIISELIVPLINSENCFSNLEGLSPHIGMTLLTVPDKNNKLKPGSYAQTIAELQHGSKKVFPDNTHYDIKDLAHYLYIHVTNQSFASRKGNYKEDIKEGIYHLVIGADKGLVKSIKFSKVNIPYGKEVMASADTANQIRFPGYYNANITMIGNNLFANGTRLYIDTSKISQFENGSGNDLTIESMLKIGGYYEVIKVHQMISKDDYVTEIEARRIQETNVKTNNANVRKLTNKEKKEQLSTTFLDKIDKEKVVVDTNIKRNWMFVK